MIVPNDLQTKQGSDSSNNNNNANNNNANQNPPEKLNGEAEKTYPNGMEFISLSRNWIFLIVLLVPFLSF